MVSHQVHNLLGFLITINKTKSKLKRIWNKHKPRGKIRRAKKRRRIPVALVVQTPTKSAMYSQQVWPQTILLHPQARRLSPFSSKYLILSVKISTSYKRYQIWKSNRNWTKMLSKLCYKTASIKTILKLHRGLKMFQTCRPLVKTKMRHVSMNNNLNKLLTLLRPLQLSNNSRRNNASYFKE